MMSTIPQEPREIAFGDIRKGDNIEARYTLDGLAYTRRGVAHSTRAGYWYTEALGVIANNYNGDWKHYLHPRPAPAEPKGLGARVRWWEEEYIATNGTPGTHRWVWVDDDGEEDCLAVLRWDEFDPDGIEVLS